MELKTGENDCGRRLDRILRKALKNHPLPLLYRLLRQGLVFVDGKPAKAQSRVNAGAVISIPLQDSPACSLALQSNVSSKLPEILWQGKGLLAVNKPAGISVHGEKSLDNIVRSYLSGKLPQSLSFRPGPLHRLDKPSSGIVVFSTSLDGARFFSASLKEHSIRKIYLALLEGKLEKEETWQDELVRDKKTKKTFLKGQSGSMSYLSGAKTAYTRVLPVAVNNNYSLIEAQIITGRTHQIRAQAAAAGRPLAGDYKYGGSPLQQNNALQKSRKKPHVGFFLHAWKLEFQDIYIEAPLPPAFRDLINRMFGSTLPFGYSSPGLPCGKSQDFHL